MARQYGREVWQRLCDFAAADTEPVQFEGGTWTARKLFFVCQHLERTTHAMSGNKHFPGGLCYVDLFCGSGICGVKHQSGLSRRYPGSALIAAGMPKPFRKLILVDKDDQNLAAVTTRIRRLGYSGEIYTIPGDVNTVVDKVEQQLPGDTLNVAFVDPYSLEIEYATIERLAAGRPLDLIILFADAYDIVRNTAEYYYSGRSDKLDRFLGLSCDWRARWERLADRTGANIRQMFADIYLEQLARIGYANSKSWPIDGPNGPVYRLVFASKHPLGLKLCEIALREDFEGNRGLFGIP